MGLHLDCGEMCIKVGSYSTVQQVKIYLLKTIKKYVIINNIDQDLLEEINEMIKNNILDYDKYKSSYMSFTMHDLIGFHCFINHSDCEGIIEPEESEEFIELFDKLEDYFDKSEYHYEDKFYLYDIFKYSADNNRPIFFT